MSGINFYGSLTEGTGSQENESVLSRTADSGGAIDLLRDVVRHHESTFYARMKGDSLEEAHVLDGDILVIDRSLIPRSGDVAVCCVDGDFVLRLLDIRKDGVWLRVMTGSGTSVPVPPGDSQTVWGVVTHVIHKLSRR